MGNFTRRKFIQVAGGGAMATYLRASPAPTLMGFDPMIQLIHEEDGLEAVRLAALADNPGIYNIAGDGVLTLSQAVRRAGGVAAPVPSFAAGPVGSVFRRARLADFSPEQVRFLTFGRAVDTTRARDKLGFVPRYTTEAAFDAFISARRADVDANHERLAALERTLVSTITRGRAHVAG